MIQADGCPIPGSSRGCSARHNSKEGGDVLIYTSGSRRRWCDWQSVVYTRVAWETAITKSKSSFLFITGHFQILFIPGHFPDFVYTRSLPDFVYKRGGMILITLVSVGRRALGRPEHSHRATATALARWLPGSASPG